MTSRTCMVPLRRRPSCMCHSVCKRIPPILIRKMTARQRLHWGWLRVWSDKANSTTTIGKGKWDWALQMFHLYDVIFFFFLAPCSSQSLISVKVCDEVFCDKVAESWTARGVEDEECESVALAEVEGMVVFVERSFVCCRNLEEGSAVNGNQV